MVHSIPRRLSIYCQPTPDKRLRYPGKSPREESLMPALLSKFPTRRIHKTPLHPFQHPIMAPRAELKVNRMVFRSQIARMIHAERMAKKESESRLQRVNLR